MSQNDDRSEFGTGTGTEKTISDDVRLVRRLQQGAAREADSERLFKSCYPRVYGFFRRRGFDRQDAEDLAQDTLVRAFREIESLRRPERFRGWLFAAATNVFRNEVRDRKRLKRDALEVSLDAAREDGAPVLDLAQDRPLPDEQLFGKERREQLRAALETLPPKMRQCYRLRFEQGLKYRQVAAVLKISIDTVKAHLSQARQRLAKRVAEDLDKETPDDA